MKLSCYSLFVLALLAFSSCQKGDAAKDDFKKLPGKDGTEQDGVSCFELVYPVTFTMPDGTEITMNDGEDWAGIKAWYEAHPDSKAKPVLQYPVEITSVKYDGVKVIQNEEEMAEAKKACSDTVSDEPIICDWDGSKVADPAVWEEHIVEPLVTSEECGDCIVSGVVKYVKINTDFAYVIYYGKGECDEWAWLVAQYGTSKKTEKCKFKLACSTEGN